MSVILRIALIVVSLLTVVWILRKIRKSQIKMQDSIWWIALSVILLVMAIFPQIVYWFTNSMNIQSPANGVFLVIIFALMMKVFSLSLKISQLEEKISTLAQEVGIRTHSKTDISDVKEGDEE